MSIAKVVRGISLYLILFVSYLILKNVFDEIGITRVVCFVLGILVGKDIFAYSNK